MENKNKEKFEVRITDLTTGREYHVGKTDCLFLVSYEGCGSRCIRLSSCDIMTKAAVYASVKQCFDDTMKDETVVAAIVNALSSTPYLVVEDN